MVTVGTDPSSGRAPVSRIAKTANTAIAEKAMIQSAGMNGLIHEPCVAFTSRFANRGVVPPNSETSGSAEGKKYLSKMIAAAVA